MSQELEKKKKHTHKMKIIFSGSNRRLTFFYSLQPFFNVIDHVHRDSIDHRNFSVIIFKDEYHIEVLQVELNSFKVNELNVFKCDNEWRLE